MILFRQRECCYHSINLYFVSMKLIPIHLQEFPAEEEKLNKWVLRYKQLLHQLSLREIPDHVVVKINGKTEELNALGVSPKELSKAVQKKQEEIIRLIGKEMKLVPKHHYRNMWMAIGIAAFGIPIGTAFGSSVDNLGILGVGLPIGLAIGAGIDQKAFEEGRQIDLEVESGSRGSSGKNNPQT